MSSASLKSSLLLAALLAAGNAFADQAGCSADKLSVDTGLLEPFSRVNTAQACAASSQIELNAVKSEGASASLCVHTYQDLFELSKGLKQQLAATGADLTAQKIDCNKTPAECKSFYAETISHLKQGQAAEARAQSAIQNLLNLAKKLTEANAIPQGAKGKGGSMFARYEAYRAQLAANLNAAPNLEAAKALPAGARPVVKASSIGAPNLGEAWLKLTGAPFTKPAPAAGGFGKIYQELRGAAALAQGVQSFATCKAAEQADKASQVTKMIAKLETAQKQSGGNPQSAAFVQKTQGGDHSTITGKTATGAQQPAGGQLTQKAGGAQEASLGSSLDGASKLLQQASGMAGQLMKQQQQSAQSGGGAATSAMASLGGAQTNSSATAAAPAAAAAQPTSYALLGNSVATGDAATGSVSAATGSSQVGSTVPAAAKSAGSNTGENLAATATGSSGSTARGTGSTSLASFGSVSGGSSASAGGGANLAANATGASLMNPDGTVNSNNNSQSYGGSGGSFGSGGSSSGSSSNSGSTALSPSAMKALDDQFNAATSNAATAKFDLAPLPSLAALPALEAPATSATPLSTGVMPFALGEQSQGSAPEAAAIAQQVPAQESQPHSALAAVRAATLTRAPQTFSSQPFLGSDNVTLFQRIHTTHERALRRLHPVTAAAL